MTIYKHKLEDKVQAKSSDKEPPAVLTDDDEISEDDSRMDSYFIKNSRRTMLLRRRPSILKWFIAVLVLFVVFSILGTIFWHQKTNSKPEKPYVMSVRMHYHFWKDNAAGVKRSFKVGGEFYQQVEIDIHNEAYEKLNVPPLVTAQRAEILHDFDQKWTAIISLDRGHCFLLPLNSTFVKPLREFLELVKNIKAGHDSTDAEVINDDYSVLSTQIRNVSQFGEHIHRRCQYLETYQLVRGDTPLDLSKKSVCHFRGEQYCLGSAGTKYMGFVHISQCVQ